MKYSIALIIVLAINYYPQDLTNIYKDYIPDIIFQNKSHLQLVNTTLESYINIHPDLIYYYLKNIEIQYGTTISDRYFHQNIFEIKKLYSYRYFDWIIKLRQKIISLNLDKELEYVCLDFLDDYFNDEIEKIDVPD